MKKIRLIGLTLAGVMMISLVGCGTNPDNGNNDTDDNVTTTVENQSIDKNDLGVSFELTGDYADCTVSDLTDSEASEMLEGCLGGFVISKMVDEQNVELAKVIVAKNDLILDSNVRAQFPFAFNGNVYSVLAALPMTDTTSDNFETIQTLQNNIITTQLITLLFDESVLPGGDGERIDIYNVDNSGAATSGTSDTQETPDVPDENDVNGVEDQNQEVLDLDKLPDLTNETVNNS